MPRQSKFTGRKFTASQSKHNCRPPFLLRYEDESDGGAVERVERGGGENGKDVGQDSQAGGRVQ